MRARLLLWGTTLILTMACDRDKAIQGDAPPPAPVVKPGLCATGGGEAKDPIAGKLFPGTVGSYCIDPHGETRAYGADAKGSLEQVCTELFDGECEVYRSFGLERVVTLRYVDGAGSPGAVNVNLSRFKAIPAAYGFFTKRIVADSDPIESAPAILDAGAAAGLGTGIAYVWRGKYVVELSYTNELESPEQIKASSQKILPGLARAIGEQVPGDKQLPGAARWLPVNERIKLGIVFEPDDALGIHGVGPAAIGYYQNAGKRWRLLSIEREDEAAASDVMKTLLKIDGARRIKEPRPAVSVPVRQSDAEAPQQWLLERQGARIFGVGDEPFAAVGDAGPSSVLAESERFRLLTQAFSALVPDGAKSVQSQTP